MEKKIKDAPINLTIVVGGHAVGKTYYCNQLKDQQSDVMVIPYDSMLYSLRSDYLVSQIVEDSVTDSIFTWMWSLAHMYPKSRIVIDGFPNRMDTYRRFFECCDKIQIVHVVINVNDAMVINNRKRKLGLPHFNGDFYKDYFRTHDFLTNTDFMYMCIDFDALYKPITNELKVSPMKKALVNSV